MLVKLALGVLRRADLTISERGLFTGIVLEKLGAIPLHALITSSEEGILIHGEPLSIEKMRVLRESALQALDNQALNIIADQVRFVAFKEGLATGRPPEELIFFRSALWFCEQLKSYLQTLSQQGE